MKPSLLLASLRMAISLSIILGPLAQLPSAFAQAPAPTALPPAAGEWKTAVFAGGCFWCMQYAFDHVPGVKKTVVGYTGGTTTNPSYDEVSDGATGHAESIQVFYDPAATSYEKLLRIFWLNIDPTQRNGQFADHGTQYRTAIFTFDAEQKRLAEASKAALGQTEEFKGKRIATLIAPAGTFYPAEEHHQKYYQKAPDHFQAYEVNSGRAGYVERHEQAEKAAAKSNH